MSGLDNGSRAQDRGFRYHEHTADITIECWGPTMEAAFEQAAVATFEVIVDTSTVEAIDMEEIRVEGIDLEELLVEWVGQLIALIDLTERFYSRFEVTRIAEEDGRMGLVGRAWGETIDLSRHDVRTEVKAMTYADMSIKEEGELVRLRFTLDL